MKFFYVMTKNPYFPFHTLVMASAAPFPSATSHLNSWILCIPMKLIRHSFLQYSFKSEYFASIILLFDIVKKFLNSHFEKSSLESQIVKQENAPIFLLHILPKCFHGWMDWIVRYNIHPCCNKPAIFNLNLRYKISLSSLSHLIPMSRVFPTKSWENHVNLTVAGIFFYH